MFFFLIQIFQQHPLKNCYGQSNASSPEQWNFTTTAQVPVKGVGEPNTALLSLVLMTGTYFIAFYLRMFKNSSFFPGRVSTRLCVSVGCRWTNNKIEHFGGSMPMHDVALGFILQSDINETVRLAIRYQKVKCCTTNSF